MKITVEKTGILVALDETNRARRWEGATESGIPVIALIAALSPQTLDPAALAQFEAEFAERPAPDAPYEERVRALVEGLLARLIGELKSQPYRRENVHAALNALAAAAGVIIAGAEDETLVDWFISAVSINMVEGLAELRRQKTEGENGKSAGGGA